MPYTSRNEHVTVVETTSKNKKQIEKLFVPWADPSSLQNEKPVHDKEVKPWSTYIKPNEKDS